MPPTFDTDHDLIEACARCFALDELHALAIVPAGAEDSAKAATLAAEFCALALSIRHTYAGTLNGALAKARLAHQLAAPDGGWPAWMGNDYKGDPDLLALSACADIMRLTPKVRRRSRRQQTQVRLV